MAMKMISVFFLIFISSTHAFQSGAPTSVCQTLMPFHGGGIPPQAGLSPYSIVTRQQGGVVQVSVGSALGVRFKGFILQGRTQYGEILGNFQVSPVTDGHTIDCANQGDTITHNNNDEKEHLDVLWVPPEGYEGPIIFNGTVAQNYNTFWVGIESPSIQITRGSVDNNFRGDPFYRGCGETKYCFGAPEGCTVSQNCNSAVTVHPTGDSHIFEMKAGGNAAWVGVGLSDDNKMGDDSVIECVKLPNGQVDAYMSWTGAKPYSSTRLSDPKVGIRLQNASISEDVLYCSVERNSRTNVNGHAFDLTANPFHILIASGSGAKANTVDFHDLTFAASTQPEALSSNANTRITPRPVQTTPPYYSPEVSTEASTDFDPFLQRVWE
ncbi:hypothetical protein JTB14_016859 [Gonioctena quinquepunctata]|nr:hypothetical protein JTB14_016859 [Gonioctena quinquepunctata]